MCSCGTQGSSCATSLPRSPSTSLPAVVPAGWILSRVNPVAARCATDVRKAFRTMPMACNPARPARSCAILARVHRHLTTAATCHSRRELSEPVPWHPNFCGFGRHLWRDGVSGEVVEYGPSTHVNSLVSTPPSTPQRCAEAERASLTFHPTVHTPTGMSPSESLGQPILWVGPYRRVHT